MSCNLNIVKLFRVSRTLFTRDDGSPAVFYSASPNDALVEIIEKGGGLMTDNKEDDCIRLCEGRNDPEISQGYLPCSYIKHCVMRNHFIREKVFRESYLKQKTSPTKERKNSGGSSIDGDGDGFESDGPKQNFIVCPQAKGRKKYTIEEDKKIIKYLITRHAYKKVRGNAVWQEMESLKLMEHTYQSMRTRYLRCILPMIHTYNIPDTWIDKLTGKPSKNLTVSDSDDEDEDGKDVDSDIDNNEDSPMEGEEQEENVDDNSSSDESGTEGKQDKRRQTEENTKYAILKDDFPPTTEFPEAISKDWGKTLDPETKKTLKGMTSALPTQERLSKSGQSSTPCDQPPTHFSPSKRDEGNCDSRDPLSEKSSSIRTPSGMFEIFSVEAGAQSLQFSAKTNMKVETFLVDDDRVDQWILQEISPDKTLPSGLLNSSEKNCPRGQSHSFSSMQFSGSETNDGTRRRKREAHVNESLSPGSCIDAILTLSRRPDAGPSHSKVKATRRLLEENTDVANGIVGNEPTYRTSV